MCGRAAGKRAEVENTWRAAGAPPLGKSQSGLTSHSPGWAGRMRCSAERGDLWLCQQELITTTGEVFSSRGCLMAFRGLHNGSSRQVGHLCVRGGLAPWSALPSEPLWGYLDARKRPTLRPDARDSVSRLFPSYPCQALHSAGSLHLQPPRTTATKGQATTTSGLPHAPCTRPGVPQCSPARGWRVGDPCQGPASSPPVPCDAWRKFPPPAMTSQALPFPEPWFPAGFCWLLSFPWRSQACPPPGTLHLLFLPHPPPMPPEYSASDLPRLVPNPSGLLHCHLLRRPSLTTPAEAAPPSGPPLLAITASSLFSQEWASLKGPVVFMWCMRCGLWWPLEGRASPVRAWCLTGVWYGPVQ